MNARKSLLLVGGTDGHVERAVDSGASVVLLQHPEKLTAFQRESAAVLHEVDYTDWDAVLPLARAVRRRHGTQAVLSLTEGGLATAARLQDVFGLGDGKRYEVARRMRDKALMRQWLTANGHPSTPSAPVTDADSLRAFGAREGYPFIVKPTATTAGFGLTRVADPQDVERVWRRIEGLRGRRTDRGSTLFTAEAFLMEAYIDGTEYSVETFSFSGRHVVVAVTEKLVDEAHFAELGHALPARLDPHRERELTEAVVSFLTTMGVTDGPGHTEIRLSRRGPLVIEAHNRVGGGHLNELVTAAYGLDLSALAVSWALGTAEPLPGRPSALAAACTRFVLRDPGTVTAVSGVDEVRRQEGVLAADVSVRPGDVVRPLRDNWDRIGSVAVTAPDTDSAVARCERLAAEAVRVDVAPGEAVRPLPEEVSV